MIIVLYAVRCSLQHVVSLISFIFQVFFSTDLIAEDAAFWGELLQAVTDFVSHNKGFFGNS